MFFCVPLRKEKNGGSTQHTQRKKEAESVCFIMAELRDIACEYLVYGASGFFGQWIVKVLNDAGKKFVCGKARLEDRSQIEQELIVYQPSYVISAAGLAGTPNIVRLVTSWFYFRHAPFLHHAHGFLYHPCFFPKSQFFFVQHNDDSCIRKFIQQFFQCIVLNMIHSNPNELNMNE